MRTKREKEPLQRLQDQFGDFLDLDVVFLAHRADAVLEVGHAVGADGGEDAGPGKISESDWLCPPPSLDAG